jgi:hypothetical protein
MRRKAAVPFRGQKPVAFSPGAGSFFRFSCPVALFASYIFILEHFNFETLHSAR